MAAVGGIESSSAILAHTHGAGTFATTITGATVASSSHNHVISHAHIWSFNDYISTNLFNNYGLSSLDDSTVSISASGYQWSSTNHTIFASGSSTTPVLQQRFNQTQGDVSMYTTGVLSPPAGANGATAASGTPSSTVASITGSNTVAGTSGSTGSGASFPLVQPTIVLNYIIKA